jgi:hypothetical protein
MPRSILEAEGRPSPTRLYAAVAHAVRQKASLGFDHPRAFHPANRVFETDAARGDRTRVGVLGGCEVTATRRALGEAERDPSASIPRDPQILRETTPMEEGSASQIRAAFLRCLALSGVAQEAAVTGRRDPARGLTEWPLLWLRE